MAHFEQQEFCRKIKEKYPKYFKGKKVLDIGSLDINGNNRFLLDSCNYIGLDVGEGPNVDVVQVAHLYDAPDEYFDLIISTEVFEHDMFYESSIINIIRMLKPGGAFIFTCASTGREEHGTRKSDGSWAAPLLIEISEEWSDYYKNITEKDIIKIEGFKECFPDGIFEYSPIPGDLYFFGVKGGIEKNSRYSEEETISLINPGEYEKDIFVIDSWPDTENKEKDLLSCIKRLREFSGIPILLVSHYPIKPEIQKLVDYYIYDKENPILLNSEFSDYSVSSGRWTQMGNFRIDSELPYHHDYAIWTSLKNAFSFCKYLGKENIHFMEYDNLIDTFQYKQSFLERINLRDAIIYEYSEGSTNDLDPYCSTFIFSIKTDIALNVLGKINSKREYFINRDKGWQLERVFLKYLKEITSNIEISQYIPNQNELNTQAVWNRDGIFRGDGIFQVYLGVDLSGDLYCHLLSGFHDVPAEKDYLIEIKYDGKTQFDLLKIGEIKFIKIGKYKKGLKAEVRYMGINIFSEFLGEDIEEFRKMNKITKISEINISNFRYNFIDGAYFEINEDPNSKYRISFIDKSTNLEKYWAEISGNSWARCNHKYFIDWKIKLTNHFGKTVKEIDIDLKSRKVYIPLESKSLGDSLAWIPYVDEFRKKHKCQVVCSTFWNSLFEESYPEIEFVNPGSVVEGIEALYRIGWFYGENGVDYDMNPSDFKKFPLQKTASDILGLEYEEIKPRIKFRKKERINKIGIGINSTAQAKYWNNPKGWQELTDWIISMGYEVIILSSEEDNYMGNKYPKGAKRLNPGPIENVIEELSECKAFVGISSGLTWLSWATETPTVQISGFTEPFNEPDSGIIKVSAPPGKCSGCANRLRLDPGDWNWCPDHQNTERQFECSKYIGAKEVIDKLFSLINN